MCLLYKHGKVVSKHEIDVVKKWIYMQRIICAIQTRQ